MYNTATGPCRSWTRPLLPAEGFLHDKKLLALIILVIILNLGHTADHIARGDLTWPLTASSLPSVIITLAIYAILGFGLYFYLTNKVGPGFWAIAAGIGVLFGWLAHFSPFTDQTPQYICSVTNRSSFQTLYRGECEQSYRPARFDFGLSRACSARTWRLWSPCY